MLIFVSGFINYPNIWTPIAAIFISLFLSWRKSLPFEEQLLRWLFLLYIGWGSLEWFILHTFFRDYTANFIGWQPSSFQFELAAANLSYAILGIIAFWNKNYGFRLALGIGFIIWSFSDWLGHTFEIVAPVNFNNSYHVGSLFYTNLILPVLILILLICTRTKSD
jgi:hypothetical protein